MKIGDGKEKNGKRTRSEIRYGSVEAESGRLYLVTRPSLPNSNLHISICILLFQDVSIFFSKSNRKLAEYILFCTQEEVTRLDLILVDASLLWR
jgi:hypothetical protein